MPDNIKMPHFIPDRTCSHVYLYHEQLCTTCQTKTCLTICPTQVFQLSKEDSDTIEVLYRQCVECGACRLACPHKNIAFNYPKGSYGVIFHQG